MEGKRTTRGGGGRRRLVRLRGTLAGRALNFDYAYTDGKALGRIDRFSLELEF